MAHAYGGPELIYDDSGPLVSADLRPGNRYELHDGHPIYCAPTGGDGARGTIAGAEILDTDPAVKEAGIDAGYSPTPGMLRAPDVSVGNVPDQFGWIKGVPPLALEYAGTGQDEAKLGAKIDDLLQAGTRFVWVVRLVGPRRIEVYEKGKPMRTCGPGEELAAPGILHNKFPVEAFYDRGTAHRLTLRNLLQRQGYENLEEVREEGREEGRGKGREEGREAGREEGREEGRVAALLTVLGARGIEIPEAQRAQIAACRDAATLDGWLRRAASAERLEEVLGS